MLRYNLTNLALEKRHPIFLVKDLPTTILWREDILAVLAYDNTVEIYNNRGQEQAPIASYPLMRPERLIEGEGLAWLDNNQLFVLNPQNPKETKPVVMASRTQSLLAWYEEKLFTLRSTEAGYEIWRQDGTNTGSAQRLTDWRGQPGLQRLRSGNTLALTDTAGFALFDLAAGTLITKRALPMIDQLQAKPLLVSNQDLVFCDGFAQPFAAGAPDPPFARQAESGAFSLCRSRKRHAVARAAWHRTRKPRGCRPGADSRPERGLGCFFRNQPRRGRPEPDRPAFGSFADS